MPPILFGKGERGDKVGVSDLFDVAMVAGVAMLFVVALVMVVG